MSLNAIITLIFENECKKNADRLAFEYFFLALDRTFN